MSREVENAHKTPPKEYREGGATAKTDYADPANYKYPIDTEEHVRAAISYFSKPKNSGMYSAGQQKKIWGRIHAAAKKHGIEVELFEKAASADHAGEPNINPKPAHMPDKTTEVMVSGRVHQAAKRSFSQKNFKRQQNPTKLPARVKAAVMGKSGDGSGLGIVRQTFSPTSEGSRGGKVIGHTSSGRAIYASSKPHEGHAQQFMYLERQLGPRAEKHRKKYFKDWSPQDHTEAAASHQKAGEDTAARAHRHMATMTQHHLTATVLAGKMRKGNDDNEDGDDSAKREKAQMLGGKLGSRVAEIQREAGLRKAEGSRGGHVIGHTKSGHPVYSHMEVAHSHYENFLRHEHESASKAHFEAAHRNRALSNKKLVEHHTRLGYAHAVEAKKSMSKSAHSTAWKRLAADVEKVAEAEESEEVEKAGGGGGGEGSRGGHIISHTKSGKPIYGKGHANYAKVSDEVPDDTNAKHVMASHKGYTKQDHMDAAHAHMREANTVMRDREPNSPIPSEAIHHGLLSHAHEAAASHTQKRSDLKVAKSGAHEVLGEYLEKAEGSRGGHVIGHTKSGKPVYGHQHAMHSVMGETKDIDKRVASHTRGWSSQDHHEAADMHAHSGNQMQAIAHRRRAGKLERMGKSQTAAEVLDEYLAKGPYRHGGLPHDEEPSEDLIDDNPSNGGPFSTRNQGDAKTNGDSGETSFPDEAENIAKQRVRRNKGDGRDRDKSSDTSWPPGAPDTPVKRIDYAKSMAPSNYTRQELEHTVRGRQALWTLRSQEKQRGGPDVVVGRGVPGPAKARPKDLVKSTIIQRGPILQEVRSNLDARASELVKGGQFYSGGRTPALAPVTNHLTSQVLCKSCGAHHAALFSACPGCGVGGVLQKSFAAQVAQQMGHPVVMQPAVLRQPPRGDVYAPTVALDD